MTATWQLILTGATLLWASIYVGMYLYRALPLGGNQRRGCGGCGGCSSINQPQNLIQLSRNSDR